MVSFLRAPRRRAGSAGPTPVPTASLTLAQRAAAHMAVALLLDYPEEETFAHRLEAVGELLTASGQAGGTEVPALPVLPGAVARPLVAFTERARSMGQRTLAERYVATFDQRRRCCLYLSYYAVGDTRHRGAAILAFKEALAAAGFELSREELPDYLPLVLEASAQAAQAAAQAEQAEVTGWTEASDGVVPSGTGGPARETADATDAADAADSALSLEVMDTLLAAHREGIEVLHAALADAASPYASLLEALIATLPEVDEATAERVRALVSAGPPTETVGVTDILPFPTMAAPLAGPAAGLAEPGLARHDAPPAAAGSPLSPAPATAPTDSPEPARSHQEAHA